MPIGTRASSSARLRITSRRSGSNPRNAVAIGSRGFVRLKLGDIDQSILDYDAAIRLNPKFAGALYGRGLAK
jgi:hypothetical protein